MQLKGRFGSASEPRPAIVRLGPLEHRILEEVWSCKSLTVRELLAGPLMNPELSFAAMIGKTQLMKQRLINGLKDYVPFWAAEALLSGWG